MRLLRNLNALRRRLMTALFGPQLTLTATITRADGTVEKPRRVVKKRSHNWDVQAIAGTPPEPKE